jgi:phenylacetate-CoA oxygenase PaaH subunit
MKVYEVFRQERKGQPFQHAGSLTAPDERFAEEYAREFYGRRGESEAVWVVPRDAVHEIAQFPDELERNYHRVDGYSLKEKLGKARAAAKKAPHFPRDELDPSLRSGGDEESSGRTRGSATRSR